MHYINRQLTIILYYSLCKLFKPIYKIHLYIPPNSDKIMTTNNQNIGVIIVEKLGSLKALTIKDYKEEELFKKCGFKKADHFGKQTEWTVKVDGVKYIVSLFGKTEGKANTENKYDFPPPVDNTLYFGNCVLVCSTVADKAIISLSIPHWNKIYEKLFGGFEDLNATNLEDEMEVDELDAIPAEKKTKQGYLNDGFVVDSDSDEVTGSEEDESEDVDGSGEEEEEIEGIVLEDIGSELSEDEYDYSDEDDDDIIENKKV